MSNEGSSWLDLPKPKVTAGCSSSAGLFSLVTFEHEAGFEAIPHSYINGVSANADLSRITVHSAQCVVEIEGINLQYIFDKLRSRQLDRVSIGEDEEMRVDRIIVHR